MFKERLFTPGPTQLLPSVQTAMAHPIIHHRTDEFRSIFKEVLEGLRYLYETEGDVLCLPLQEVERWRAPWSTC